MNLARFRLCRLCGTDENIGPEIRGHQGFGIPTRGVPFGTLPRIAQGTMHLREFLKQYLRLNRTSPGYAQQLTIAVELFALHLGRPPRVADLTREKISAFVAWLERTPYRNCQPRKPHTIHGRRASLITLAIAAADEGRVQHPRKIRRVPLPELLVDGFDETQMRRLIAVADQWPGRFHTLPLDCALWLGAFFRFAWESGMRLGDVLAMERAWIWPGGKLSFVQAKTGHAHCVTLRAATLAKIDLLCAAHGRRLIFPSFGKKKTTHDLFRRVLDKAGFAHAMPTKFIRRGSSSEVEKKNPGMGWRHLGHRSPGLFEKSYRVRRICDPERPMPPEVG